MSLWVNGWASAWVSWRLMCFFLISGFLVSNSLVTKQDSLFFFKARLVRIFPALWFMLLLTVFVLGPVFSTLSDLPSI